LNIHGLQAAETAEGGGGRRNERCDEWGVTHGSHGARVISVTCVPVSEWTAVYSLGEFPMHN